MGVTAAPLPDTAEWQSGVVIWSLCHGDTAGMSTTGYRGTGGLSSLAGDGAGPEDQFWAAAPEWWVSTG